MHGLENAELLIRENLYKLINNYNEAEPLSVIIVNKDNVIKLNYSY